ncbi:MAG: hypothetical protein QGM49_07180 [Actinomycetota bacterium]|nr:hypothetical protein [Actinomycetota bacterium]
MYSDSHRRGASGFRLIAVAAVLALVAAACSGVDSPGGTPEGPTGDGESFAREAEGGDPAFEEFLNAPPSPISATVTLDEAGASEATIGPEGGSVEADGSDGAHYRLDFPPGALADEVLIRIVPIADLVSPVISRFTGGVQFEPEGLVMIVPATLTITGVVVPDDVAGYSYSGEGSELVSTPVTTTGDAVELTVFHFSGTAAGSPSSDAPPNRPTDPRARMRQLLVENLVRTGECLDGDSNLAGFTTLTNYYVNWYKNEVGPMLERGAVDDMVLGAAIDEFIRWYLLPIQWGQVGLLCDSELEESGYEFHDKAFELLSKGLVNAIDTAAKVCASAHDLGEARNIAGWTAVALSLDQAYGFPIEDPD